MEGVPSPHWDPISCSDSLAAAAAPALPLLHLSAVAYCPRRRLVFVHGGVTAAVGADNTSDNALPPLGIAGTDSASAITVDDDANCPRVSSSSSSPSSLLLPPEPLLIPFTASLAPPASLVMAHGAAPHGHTAVLETPNGRWHGLGCGGGLFTCTNRTDKEGRTAMVGSGGRGGESAEAEEAVLRLRFFPKEMAKVMRSERKWRLKSNDNDGKNGGRRKGKEAREGQTGGKTEGVEEHVAGEASQASPSSSSRRIRHTSAVSTFFHSLLRSPIGAAFDPSTHSYFETIPAPQTYFDAVSNPSSIKKMLLKNDDDSKRGEKKGREREGGEEEGPSPARGLSGGGICVKREALIRPQQQQQQDGAEGANASNDLAPNANEGGEDGNSLSAALAIGTFLPRAATPAPRRHSHVGFFANGGDSFVIHGGIGPATSPSAGGSATAATAIAPISSEVFAYHLLTGRWERLTNTFGGDAAPAMAGHAVLPVFGGPKMEAAEGGPATSSVSENRSCVATAMLQNGSDASLFLVVGPVMATAAEISYGDYGNSNSSAAALIPAMGVYLLDLSRPGGGRAWTRLSLSAAGNEGCGRGGIRHPSRRFFLLAPAAAPPSSSVIAGNSIAEDNNCGRSGGGGVLSAHYAHLTPAALDFFLVGGVTNTAASYSSSEASSSSSAAAAARLLNDCYRYSAVTGKWTEIIDFASPRASSLATVPFTPQLARVGAEREENNKDEHEEESDSTAAEKLLRRWAASHTTVFAASGAPGQNPSEEGGAEEEERKREQQKAASAATSAATTALIRGRAFVFHTAFAAAEAETSSSPSSSSSSVLTFINATERVDLDIGRPFYAVEEGGGGDAMFSRSTTTASAVVNAARGAPTKKKDNGAAAKAAVLPPPSLRFAGFGNVSLQKEIAQRRAAAEEATRKNRKDALKKKRQREEDGSCDEDNGMAAHGGESNDATSSSGNGGASAPTTTKPPRRHEQMFAAIAEASLEGRREEARRRIRALEREAEAEAEREREAAEQQQQRSTTANSLKKAAAGGQHANGSYARMAAIVQPRPLLCTAALAASITRTRFLPSASPLSILLASRHRTNSAATASVATAAVGGGTDDNSIDEDLSLLEVFAKAKTVSSTPPAILTQTAELSSTPPPPQQLPFSFIVAVAASAAGSSAPPLLTAIGVVAVGEGARRGRRGPNMSAVGGGGGPSSTRRVAPLTLTTPGAVAVMRTLLSAPLLPPPSLPLPPNTEHSEGVVGGEGEGEDAATGGSSAITTVGASSEETPATAAVAVAANGGGADDDDDDGFGIDVDVGDLFSDGGDGGNVDAIAAAAVTAEEDDHHGSAEDDGHNNVPPPTTISTTTGGDVGAEEEAIADDGLGIDVDVGDLFGDDGDDAGDDENAVICNSMEGRGEGGADCDGIDLDADDLFGGEAHGNDDADDGPTISPAVADVVAVPSVGEAGAVDDDIGGLFFDFE